MIDSLLKVYGDVNYTIDYKSGKKEEFEFKNTVLRIGRISLAKVLTNQIGDTFNLFVIRMLFGDGGTQSGEKKFVNDNRNGLFGLIRLSKPVIATINPDVPTQALFTSVISFDEVVGVTLNEMALQMFSGDLFSMATFPDLTKTDEMQITWNWRQNFV